MPETIRQRKHDSNCEPGSAGGSAAAYERFDTNQTDLIALPSLDSATECVAALQSMLEWASMPTPHAPYNLSMEERARLEERLCDPADDSIFQADFASLVTAQITVNNYRTALGLDLTRKARCKHRHYR